MAAPVPKNKWAWNYDYCFHCGTTEIKHKGWGLCLRCWDKNRKDDPKRKATSLKASRNYKKRHRHKDWFKKSCRERVKKYYHKNKDNPEFRKKYREANLKSYYKLKGAKDRVQKRRVWQRRTRLRKYYREFIKGNPFYLRKYSGGLQFRCEGCNNNCLTQAPVKPEGEIYIWELNIFKEILIKNCNK